MPPTPALSPARDPLGRSYQTLGLWDQAAATQEMLDAWTCAWGAWSDYLTRLAGASGPMEVLDAGTRLMTDSIEICTRTAAVRLRDGGVTTPLLNDA